MKLHLTKTTLLCCMCLYLLQTHIASAQASKSNTKTFKKNNLSIARGTSWLWEPELAGYDRNALNSMPTISYERSIDHHWGIQASFSVWRLSEETSAENFIMYNFLEDENNVVGRKFSRTKPYYVDLMGRYNLCNYRQHTVKAYLGASLSWSPLSRVVFYDFYIQEGPLDFVSETETKQQFLFGPIAKLAYQYTFWKNRLQAGAFSTFRYYPQLNNKQLDIGIQLGFNF